MPTDRLLLMKVICNKDALLHCLYSRSNSELGFCTTKRNNFWRESLQTVSYPYIIAQQSIVPLIENPRHKVLSLAMPQTISKISGDSEREHSIANYAIRQKQSVSSMHMLHPIDVTTMCVRHILINTKICSICRTLHQWIGCQFCRTDTKGMPYYAVVFN